MPVDEIKPTRSGLLIVRRRMALAERIHHLLKMKLDGMMLELVRLTDQAARERKELEEKTGISGTLILEWVNRADLYRIKGVGEEYSDLLEAAGVDTVPELAQRNPDNLYEALVALNAEKKLVRHMPGRAQVASWIAQAKELPRVMTY